MSRRLLLQSILKFREGIKSGTAKVQDIVEDYFKSSGKSVTDEDRAIILNEFAESAPSNVTTLEGVDAVETIMPMGGAKSKTPFTDQLRKENPDVEITGNETFAQLLEKFKPKEEGISSLFPKGKRGEIFDVDNSKRDEAAEFIRKMREANIKNKDIKNLFKETGGDIEQGKRAATTLARAADMSADTKIKQELLSELDEMKMDRPPRFFKDEKMGFYDMRGVLDDLTTTINNRIQDDLIEQGVPEEKVDDIFFTIRENIRRGSRSNLRNDPKALVAKIKDEIEMEGVTYDTDFWNKYVDEIMSLVRTPEPRFMYGGVV